MFQVDGLPWNVATRDVQTYLHNILRNLDYLHIAQFLHLDEKTTPSMSSSEKRPNLQEDEREWVDNKILDISSATM